MGGKSPSFLEDTFLSASEVDPQLTPWFTPARRF